MMMLTNGINAIVAWLSAHTWAHWLLIVPMAIGIGLAEGHWKVASGLCAYLVGQFIGMAILHRSVSDNIDNLMRDVARDPTGDA